MFATILNVIILGTALILTTFKTNYQVSYFGWYEKILMFVITHMRFLCVVFYIKLITVISCHYRNIVIQTLISVVHRSTLNFNKTNITCIHIVAIPYLFCKLQKII